MTVQPTLTPEQQAQTCQECAHDPHAAPRRYCSTGGTCYCAHQSCPAFDPARVLVRGHPNIHPFRPKEA